VKDTKDETYQPLLDPMKTGRFFALNIQELIYNDVAQD
jgi:hypothetical protein